MLPLQPDVRQSGDDTIRDLMARAPFPGGLITRDQVVLNSHGSNTHTNRDVPLLSPGGEGMLC